MFFKTVLVLLCASWAPNGQGWNIGDGRIISRIAGRTDADVRRRVKLSATPQPFSLLNPSLVTPEQLKTVSFNDELWCILMQIVRLLLLKNFS